MLNSLVKDSVIYTIATVLAKGIQFFLLPVITRYLTPLEYGRNELLAILSLYLISIVTMEINQAVARFYPEEKNDNKKILISSTGLMFTVSALAVLLVVCLFFAERIAVIIFGSNAYLALVEVAVIAITSNGLFSYLQAQLRWDLKSLDYSLASIIFILTSTIVSIVSIVHLNLGGRSLFIGQCAGSILGSIFSFYRNRASYKIKISYTCLIDMIKFSSPLVIATILALTTQYVDRFVINYYISGLGLGVYGIASKFSSIVSLLFVGFNMAFTPLIYRNLDSKTLSGDITKVFSIFIPIAGLLSCTLFIFSKEIVTVFTSDAYYSAYMYMPLLVLSTIVSNLYLFTPGISIKKKTSFIVLITLVSAIVSLLMNVLITPLLGLLGASLISVFTAVVVFVLHYYLSQRYYRIIYNFKNYIPIFILILISSLINIYINKLNVAFYISFSIKLLMQLTIFIYVWNKYSSIRSGISFVTTKLLHLARIQPKGDSND